MYNIQLRVDTIQQNGNIFGECTLVHNAYENTKLTFGIICFKTSALDWETWQTEKIECSDTSPFPKSRSWFTPSRRPRLLIMDY